MKNELIVKDNRLITASYQLTLVEQRLMLACISQIDSRSAIDPSTEFEVKASDINDLIGDANSNNYRDLKQAVDRLYGRSISYSEGEKVVKFRWIQKAVYTSKSGTVSVKFSDDILPYLTQLTSNFTKYKIGSVSKFKNVHTLRVYEILVQWMSKGEREVSIDDLRTMLAVKYHEFRDLRRYVVQPAVDEINAHSNLWCDVGFRKCGRKVTHFQFRFGVKGQDKQPEKPKRISDDQIKAAARPGETTGQVVNRLLGNDLSKMAKLGETVEQVMQRKKAMADAKKALGKI